MDFALDDEQRALQEVMRALVSSECPPALVRSVVEGHDDGSSFWKVLVEGHWPGLAVAAEHGGSGGTTVELILTLEELGWGADPSPFLATTSQYVPLIQEVASGDTRRDLLGAVCGGGTGTVAHAADTVTVTQGTGRWRLDGEAEAVLDGDRADRIAVVADRGVFLVDPDQITVAARPIVDRTRRLAALSFAGVEPTHAFVDVSRQVERATQVAVTGLAADMVGASQHVLDLVLHHVKQRHQFGVPIGSFQAVKHMAVDVHVSIQRARALTQFAALAIAEDDGRRALATAMAKAAAGDCQRIAAQHGIQLFGGLGYTWENDLQLYVKRAKSGEPLLGSTRVHRAAAARLVLETCR